MRSVDLRLNRIRSAVLAAVLLAGTIATTSGTVAAAAAPQEDAARSGQSAIDQLGGALPVVAAEHGFSEAALRKEFLRDPSLKVDGGNRLFYVEPVAPTEPTAAASTSPFDGSIPASEAFLLNSKPGSNRVIYLDFNGETISGTAWNNYTGGTCSTGAYDSDSSPGTFSTTERNEIISVWKRVSDDYAPFDVNVTTQDPGYAAINRSSNTDNVFGARALITNSVTTCPNGKTLYDALCGGCGGIAYVGVYAFTGDYYQPAIVFQNGVGTDAKDITEAASHEIGHNIGLSHDGTPTAGYYSGHGSWAPIMGVGYYKAISQWSKGEYSNANNTQDDFAVAVSNGMPLRSDDHGDTAAAATALSGASLSVDGIISTRTDVDAFSVSVGAGAATFSASPAPTSPNLDLKLELRDSSGTVLASNDPASGSTGSDTSTGMGATISTTLAAGTYTLLIDGVGYGNPLNTGYSDYGSVGNYRLTGTVIPANGQPPTAVIGATPTSGTAPLTVAFTGSNSTDPENGTLTYSWNFGDTTTSTLANPSKTYSAGTYTARLTVTDPAGNTGTTTTTITVAAATPRIDVYATALTMAKTGNGKASGTATVTVRDNLGANAASVAVTATWTIGTKVASTKTVTSNSSGVASFSSGSLKVSAGQVVKFCVTKLVRSGWTWDQVLYAPGTATDCASWTMP